MDIDRAATDEELDAIGVACHSFLAAVGIDSPRLRSFQNGRGGMRYGLATRGPGRGVHILTDVSDNTVRSALEAWSRLIKAATVGTKDDLVIESPDG